MKLIFAKSLAFILGLIICANLGAQDFKIRVGRESGVYSVGENAVWNIETVKSATKKKEPDSVYFRIFSNSLDVFQEGELEFKDGKASISATRKTPGTLQLVLGEKLIKHSPASGAVFDPKSIEPSLPRPADFEKFWAAKIAEANAVPLNPKLEKEETPNAEVELWQITLDNIRGGKIHGQLARPKGYEGEKFPAMLIFQWAGFYPLAKIWAVEPASQGWLVLNTLAHDMPPYESREFYQKIQNAPQFKDYMKIGGEDRETSYYLAMYLSTVQAVRYLKTRPDWDGKIMVVRGGSQGGMLTLAAAALNADSISAAMAKVPGGCDFNGEMAGRLSGRPAWWDWSKECADPQKARRVAEYYDIVNFTPMIKCPTLMGIALGDRTCPPPGMFIASNQLQVPKELFIMPNAGHGSSPINPHKPYDNKEASWLRLAKQGKTPLGAKRD